MVRMPSLPIGRCLFGHGYVRDVEVAISGPVGYEVCDTIACAVHPLLLEQGNPGTVIDGNLLLQGLILRLAHVVVRACSQR